MRFLIVYLVMGVLVIPAGHSQAQAGRGKLFIVGGGHLDDSLRLRMLAEAGWKKTDRIFAVTLASSWGDSAYYWINEPFRRLTGQDCILFDSAAVHNEAALQMLLTAKIIFIGGGDQSRVMRLIQGTKTAEIMRRARDHGAMVAGTSAGAAVMSRMMITGNSLKDSTERSTFPVLTAGNLELATGLAFLDSVIIDQHFLVRSRFNRLLSAKMEHPAYDCIGIDESTALIVNGSRATVAGRNQVVVIGLPENMHVSPTGRLAARNIPVSVYLAGESFNIKR